jgi:hypothetical protein
MADRLDEVLGEARELGLLGPGPTDRARAHAEAWAAALETEVGPQLRFLDLGSGGGLPGLVFATAWSRASAVLLDSQHRRCEFLRRAVDRLDLGARVQVLEGRAETLAREETWRAAFPLVVARSFGGPASTAECAAGFLAPNGVLSVSEPPGSGDELDVRWPEEGLLGLGLGPAHRVESRGFGFVVIRRIATEMSHAVPRREGVPGRRPRWR